MADLTLQIRALAEPPDAPAMCRSPREDPPPVAAKRISSAASRATTISDIAAAAGVSKATVSRVMNGIPTVNAEIAQRVRDVVAEREFTPSRTAQSLSLGMSRTVGVLLPDFGNPMFHQVLHGFNSAAARDGYRVVVADSFEDADAEPELARDLRGRTDAIALFAPRMTRENLLALLPRISPSVVFNRTTGKNAGSVLIDYRKGTMGLARHFIDLGHSHIAFLAGPSYSRANIEREKALDDLRPTLDPGIELVVLPCGHSFHDGYGAWPTVRDSGATAVIAYNDVVALGLLGRLSEEGVSVPEDLSVAGFDDIPFSRYSSPPLTTMTAQLDVIGARIWAVLRSEMSPTPDREPVIFDPELTLRASTTVRA